MTESCENFDEEEKVSVTELYRRMGDIVEQISMRTDLPAGASPDVLSRLNHIKVPECHLVHAT